MTAAAVILVTGSRGQVGFELQRALAPLGRVVAVDRQRCDLADPAAVRDCVRSLRPDVIVNAAAYTAVDRAESERALAFAVNAESPGVLAEEAARLGAPLLHYSTDYVFDGSHSGAQVETAQTRPLNVYGASKLAGEQAVQAVSGEHWILRTSWVFGLHGANFLKTMLRLAGERETLAVVADQQGAPTSAALIADVTAHLVRAWLRGEAVPASGCYHLAAAGITDWHAYARRVIARAAAAGLPTRVAAEDIRAISTADYPTPATRPANSRLDCGKLEQALGIVLPDWTLAVDQTVDLIMENRRS